MVRRDGGLECAASVDSFDDAFGIARERPDVPDTIPRVRLKWRLTLAFVAFQESRHEELTSECRQAHAAGFAVVDELQGIIEVHHLDHGSRGWRVVDDCPVVFRNTRFMNR